jgi:hypothetical protein
MSQLLMIWGATPSLERSDVGNVSFIAVERAPDYVRRAAEAMIGSSSHSGAWWIVDESGDTAGELFAEVQQAREAGDPFEATRLCRLLDVIPQQACIALWSGGDADDLLEFHERDAFLTHVRQTAFAGADFVHAVLRRPTREGRGAA